MNIFYTRVKKLLNRNFIKVILSSIILFTISGFQVLAQENCDNEKIHGQGFTTAITSVVDNGDNTHTIVLNVKQIGCSGECKAMAHYAVEALPGTYSDVSINIITGSFNYENIDLGPNIGGTPFQGFRLTGTAGFGNGILGEFTITYTLSGGLQNQQALVKAGNKNLIVSFTKEEFETVMFCGSSNIYPYYAPPSGGKLENSLIGPELTSLYNTFSVTGEAVSDNIFQINGDKVLIKVFALQGQYNSLLTLLESASFGLTNTQGIQGLLSITGYIPITNLLLINDYPQYVNYARPVYPAQSNVGIVSSQGDISMRSNVARNAFDLSGAGVKIGVISDSYNTKLGDQAGDDILKGDLPGTTNPLNPTPVDVILDYPYGTKSDEGRAMLQIIHDVAPQSLLAFRTGFISPEDFAQGIYELYQAGCDIIVDDITYISEPFFHDGVVAQAVDNVTGLGVSYFSAAGNYGSKSYQNTFSEANAPDGISGSAHNFAGSGGLDIFQGVTVPEGNYTIVLQWDDGSPMGKTNTDLDIYLANDNGSTLFGFNRENIGGDPIEVLPFKVGPGGSETNLLIVKSAGNNDVTFKYIVFRGELTMNEYTNTGVSTIVGQANAEGAMAVGAVLYSNTPDFGVNPPTIASFSSRGGTLVNGQNRMKPDFTAPNGVNTSVDFGSLNIDNDAFPNFFGTSAAAPHAAAVGALLKEAVSKYYDTELQPAALKEILQSTAIDMNTPGFDYASGHGFIQADEALLSLANPSPVISKLLYDTTKTPGEEAITISVIGNYLTSASQIYFNDSLVESGTTLVSDTELTATIDPFTDLYPAIQVYNPPNPETNGTDGGLSNPLYFNEKETILISINDTSKIYGEILPVFSADYEVVNITGSQSIDSSDLTTAEINRILNIPFETVATALSNIGVWEIIPALSDPLNPQSSVLATDPIDIALLDRFNFVFESGLMNIEKLDLTIKPRDTCLTYGDSVKGLQFDYIFNNDMSNPSNNVVITPQDKSELLSILTEGHATALVNGRATALVNGMATALVNGQATALVNGQATALVNTSFLISDATAMVNATALVNGTFFDSESFLNATAMVNGQATALVNGQAVAMVNGALVSATALVNGRATALVNGQATALVNGRATALVNGQATALVNAVTINENSNKETIIILGDEDIAILSGAIEGSVVLKPLNLITGNTVGEHLIAPGAYLSNNFNVSYEFGKICFTAAEAHIDFKTESLTQTYSGNPILPQVSTVPDSLEVVFTFNGSETVPVDAGSYEVVATISDLNYIGSATTTLVIEPALANVSFEDSSLVQTYDGQIKQPDIITVPANVNIILTFDGQDNPPIDVGSYEVIAKVSDPNYLGSATAILNIEPATATLEFSESSLTQTYDGNEKIAVASTTPAGLSVQLTYDGIETPPKNVGSYTIYATLTDPNYIGNATAILNIEPAEASLTFTESDLVQVYDGTPKTVNVLTSPADLNVVVSYNENTTQAVDVGSYIVTATIADPNYVGTTEANLTIEPAVVSITYTSSSLEQIYDGNVKTVVAVTDPPGIDLIITFDGNNTSPVNVGNYSFTVVVDDPNYTGSGAGILSINPATANVIAGTDYIFEGDALPELSFTYSGFVNGEDESVITGTDYILSPNYNNRAGTYEIIPVAFADNYNFNPIHGVLYVNPSGAGTKHIIPKLICVEEVTSNANGFSYIANFEYENKNNDDVFIPIGEDNKFTSTGFYDESAHPSVFVAGGGSFSIPFDGNDLTWTLASYNHKGQKTSQGSTANSGSNSCSTKSLSLDFDLPLNADENIETKIYPNPASNNFNVSMGNKSIRTEDVLILDLLGRICDCKITSLSDKEISVDVSSLESGIYLIRINVNNNLQTFRFVKQ